MKLTDKSLLNDRTKINTSHQYLLYIIQIFFFFFTNYTTKKYQRV